MQEGAPQFGQNKQPKRAPSPEELKVMQEEWDKKLAAEDMPAEPTSEFDEEGQETDAHKTAVRDACLYFLNTGNTPDSWGAHRQKLQELLGHMRSNGANEHEVETFNEDYLRSIEDSMTQLVVTARAEMDEILKKDGKLSARPEIVSKRVVQELSKTVHWPREVLQSAADQAAGIGLH